MTVEGASFSTSHSSYFIHAEARGHFSDYLQNLLPLIRSGSSLISLPPAHTWPSCPPQAPAVCHRWACNCSVAWSCSEWLEESSLANEAAQRVSSPLLGYVCVCVSMRKQAGVGHHIHLVCFFKYRTAACCCVRDRQKKTRQDEYSENLSVCESNKKVKAYLNKQTQSVCACDCVHKSYCIL